MGSAFAFRVIIAFINLQINAFFVIGFFKKYAMIQPFIIIAL